MPMRLLYHAKPGGVSSGWPGSYDPRAAHFDAANYYPELGMDADIRNVVRMHAPSQVAHAADAYREGRGAGNRVRRIDLPDPNRVGIDENSIGAIDIGSPDLVGRETAHEEQRGACRRAAKSVDDLLR